jgi:hypothetical protein
MSRYPANCGLLRSTFDLLRHVTDNVTDKSARTHVFIVNVTVLRSLYPLRAYGRPALLGSTLNQFWNTLQGNPRIPTYSHLFPLIFFAAPTSCGAKYPLALTSLNELLQGRFFH